MTVPLGLLLLTVFYFWRQLIEGQVLYWGDIGLYFTPMTQFLHENLSAGRLPLWNPMILCGTPYLGNPQTWPLYPVTALLPFVSAPYFLNLTIALHVWLAGLGTYLFARRVLSFGRGAALLSAITFMFGGQFVSKEQFPNMVQASAWLPWALFCVDRLIHRHRVSDALTLGAVLGLQLLAAHPQMTLLTLYLAATWGVFTLGRIRPSLAAAARIGSLFLLAGIIGAGLAAGQILPTLGLFQDAARQKLSFFIVNRFFFPANQFGNFILPRLHGHPYFGDWSARGNFWETCCYVGWLPCLLGIIGILTSWDIKGQKQAWFWAGIFALGVWMATGGSGGLYRLAYLHLPGFRSFHDPARCLLWACFALSLLAGYGWTKAASITKIPWVAALILLLSFADLAHFGHTLYPLTQQTALHPTPPNLLAVQADPDIACHQARILAPTSGVWLRFTNYKGFWQKTPDFQTPWADTLTPNLMMPYGLRDAYGYEPVSLKNTQATAGLVAQAFSPQAAPAQQSQAASLAGVLGVKYVAVCRVNPPGASFPGLILRRVDLTLAPPGRRPSIPGFIYLMQNSRWQPRARLVGSLTPIPLTDDGSDRVILRPVTGSMATLILADTQAAGWQAAIDGVSAPINTTGGCLRSVSIPGPGAHTVIFSYRPTLFLVGLYLTLLTLLGLTACATRNIFGPGGFGRWRVE